ncbi:MAG: 4Fe-4S binding protein [Oscillospiraceae bacterium]|nr:4Fe-4S binding protein [Oscillospiraceae bacterium]
MLLNSYAKCINCYRCIHHCPALALSLSGKRCVKKVLK